MSAASIPNWRRNPRESVVVHLDQRCQYSSHDWQDSLKAHQLTPSMSRPGNCHDNAVAASFFRLLKGERIRRKIYTNREDERRATSAGACVRIIDLPFNSRHDASLLKKDRSADTSNNDPENSDS